MVNNNFYKAINYQLCGTYDDVKTIVDINGEKIDTTPNVRPYDKNVNFGAKLDGAGRTQSTMSRMLLIGAGATPPTVDDYKLENIIKDGYDATISGTTSSESMSASGKYTMTMTVTNTQAEDLVIREIGHFASGGGTLRCSMIA